MFQLPTEQELVQLTLDHWEMYNPEMYADLRQRKALHQEARAAARWTLQTAQTLVSGGMTPLEAWATVRHDRCLIEAEDEQDQKLGPETAEEETEENGWFPVEMFLNRQSAPAMDPAATTSLPMSPS